MEQPQTRRRGAALDLWLLNTGAVLGSLCLILTVLTLAFGLKPLIFSSGSMSPAIPTGSLALAVPMAAAEAQPGQVVSVLLADGVRLTHRVVSADSESGLVLKGDANPVSDLQPYRGTNVDKVVLTVPLLGYLASWLASPWLMMLGGMLCTYLLYIAFFRREQRAGVTTRTRRRSWPGVGAVVAVIAVSVPLGASVAAESTQAAWVAQAQGTSAVAAAVMHPPSNVTCAQGANNQTVVFKWGEPVPGAMAPTAYRISVQVNNSDGSPSATNTTTVVTPPLGTSTFSLDINNNAGILGSLLGLVTDLLFGYNYTATVKISATYPSDWSSDAVVYNKVHATNGGLLGAPKKLTCQLH